LVLVTLGSAALVAIVSGAASWSTRSALGALLAWQALFVVWVAWGSLDAAQLRRTTGAHGPLVTLHLVLLAVPLFVFAAGLFLTWPTTPDALFGAARVPFAGPLALTFALASVSASAWTWIAGAFVAAGLWHSLERAWRTVSPAHWPEAQPLRAACAEGFGTAVLVAGSQLATSLWPIGNGWPERIVMAWLLAICCEHLLRLLLRASQPAAGPDDFRAPVDSLLRDNLFPTEGLFRRLPPQGPAAFVRQAVVGTAFGTSVLVFLLSCFSVVKWQEVGILEVCGKAEPLLLEPGLHVHAPWPWGRVRVVESNRVRDVPLGFVPQSAGAAPQAWLWTGQHAREERDFLLGSGNELVAVNAVLHYRWPEASREVQAALYDWQDPRAVLAALAERALLHRTAATDPREIAATNSGHFSNDLRKSLQKSLETENLPLEVLDVSLITLHPPVAAAPAYLDVINAERAAARVRAQAQGAAAVALEQARAAQWSVQLAAQTAAAARVAQAQREVELFRAWHAFHAQAPAAAQRELRWQAARDALGGRTLILVDPSLLSGEIPTIMDFGDIFRESSETRSEEVRP